MKFSLHKGFSLLELMIVVAVIGILSTLAAPSYMDSVRKGKRAEARAALSEMMIQQERFFTQKNTYASFAAGSTSGDAAAFKTYSGDSATKASHLLGSEACPSPNNDIKVCARIFAVPQGSDLEAGTLQMLTIGIKTCTGTNIAVCWQ
jgi:type IV pilus assembly protein PilE